MNKKLKFKTNENTLFHSLSMLQALFLASCYNTLDTHALRLKQDDLKTTSINKNEVPYISSYYVKPVVKTNEDVVLDFYLTDFYQKEYKDGSSNDIFTVTVKIEGRDPIIKKGLKSGDNSINIGSFSEEGEVKYSILATDQYGRNSHELFNFFKVQNDKVINKYIMTNDDLINYNIKNTDNYENIVWVDIPSSGINATIIETAMNEAYENHIPQPGTYTSLRVSIDGTDEHNNYWKYNKVKYADNYDKDAVLAEATATREGIQRFLDDKAGEGYNEIVLLDGTYRIDHLKSIYIPNMTTLNMNQATIKLNQFTGDKAVMMQINNVTDSHIINGTIEGDYYTHDYNNSPNDSEWVNGVEINSESKYCSIENVTIKNITGYGGGNGIAMTRDGSLGYTYVSSKALGAFSLGDIDRTTGLQIDSTDRTTSDFIDVSKYTNSNGVGYIQVGNYLGYQGNPAGTWNIICHFYDADKNYIESIDGYLYRRVGVPDNSSFMRVTILEESYPTSLNIFYFRIPTHCAFKNVTFVNCRAVGLAQSAMKDMLVKDCDFSYSGQTLANCAYDAEDGWDLMQDVTFRGLNFHNNPLNEFLTCAGHNFVVEDMKQGKLYIWDRTNGFVYRNSKNSRGQIDLRTGARVRSGYYRIYNNEQVGNVKIVNAGGLSDNWNFVIRDNKINGSVTDNSTIAKFINCEIYGGRLGNAYHENCYVHDMKGENQGGTYVNSKIENISGNTHNTTYIVNSEVTNWVTKTYSTNNFNAINSTIKNLQINVDYWGSAGFINIENCNIENTTHLLKLPHYSMSKPVNITNNTFKSSTSDGMVWFYDDRIPTNVTPAPQETLTLKSNIIDLPNSEYLIKGLLGSETNNYLTIHLIKNILLQSQIEKYNPNSLGVDKIVIVDELAEGEEEIKEAVKAIVQSETSNDVNDIDIARNLINALPESFIKTQLQDRLNKVSIDLTLESKKISSNLDLYIKSDNMLLMSLSTNQVTFDDFSGVEDLVKEGVIEITVSSSLPYQLNAYLPNEIQNGDKSQTMDLNILNIKEGSEESYQTFENTADKIILKDNCNQGNDLVHNIDLMLKGSIAHEKDVYKTVIKFEVEQK